MSKRKANPVAKDLRTPKYKMRIEKPKKGKGSYKRVQVQSRCDSGFYFSNFRSI
jgi:stalled ribosome alternative rescue factor ArfA